MLWRGEWLTDLHITYALELLKKQFPNIDGIQSPQNDSFSVVKNEGIQIHHIVSITSCSFNQEVAVYDRKFTGGELCASLTKQLAQIYRLLIEKEDVDVDSSEDDASKDEKVMVCI